MSGATVGTEGPSPDPRPVLLLGGGGHAAVVRDALLASGGHGPGCLDDDAGPERAGGPPRLGPIDRLEALLAEHDHRLAVHAAVGDPDLRRRWLDRATDAGADAVTIVHPSAVLGSGLEIGGGVFIGPRAVVNAGARLGRGVIVNSAAVVEHDAVVGAFAHVAPAAVLTGGCVVGTAAMIGANATVLPGVSIGDRAIVGAGAVVRADVAAGTIVVGVPARAIDGGGRLRLSAGR